MCKTISDVYALLGCSKSNISRWKNNSCSTQALCKNAKLVVVKDATNESINKINNEIGSLSGEIEKKTADLFELRKGLSLWCSIQSASSEIHEHLQYADGKIDVVQESFEKLLEVEKLIPELP